jgi:copper resistance protein C
MRTPGMPAERISRALAAVVAAGVLLVVGASPALAHDRVIATTPAAEASLPSPPATVEVQLSAPPQVLGTEVRVTGPDGALASEGAPEVVDDTVRQPLADGLAAGAYTVEWRITSGDGHVITGSSGFSVAEGAAPSSSAPSSSAPATTAAAPPAEPSGEVDTDEASASAPAGSSSAPLLVGGALLVLAVAGLVLWRLRRRA